MHGRSASLAVGAFLLVILVGASRMDGGFTSVSWGAAAAALSVLALVAVVSREVRITNLELLAGSAFVFFAAWTALSLLWTSSLPRSLLELEHTLLPLAAFVAAVVGVRARRDWTLAIVVFAFALAAAVQALISDVDTPLGYANALALLCVMGMLLAAGWALERRNLHAAAGVPVLCVFAVVIVDTGSRAAWLELAGGGAVALGLRSRRPLLTMFGVLASAWVTIASLAVWESEQRSAYWGTTLAEIVRHPFLGSGAGTWQRIWLEHRDLEFSAQNAHSLYLEVLSELGPVGLGVIMIGLLLPLVAAARARRQRYVPTVTAAYAAFLIHVAVDWDWQISAVLLSGVFLGAALLGAARGIDPVAPIVLPRVVAAPALVTLIAAGVLIWAGGTFTSRAVDHLRSARWDPALTDASRANRLAPWSAEPWLLRGEAELAKGHPDEARLSFRRGLELDGNDVVLWRALARVSSGTELRHARERVAQLDPEGQKPWASE